MKGVFEEYAESQILQMTGRAGRPQVGNEWDQRNARLLMVLKLHNWTKRVYLENREETGNGLYHMHVQHLINACIISQISISV